MGVAAVIGATLAGGYLSGRAQQQQANAQAAQYEANARIAYDNAEKLQNQAEQQAQNNAINEENKRRRIRQLQGSNIANVGASGVMASGSVAGALADSAYNSEMDLAIERYNNRRNVDQYFQASTDSVNQGDVYKSNADQYRKAGKRAMMNSMLQSGLSLAGSLYSPKSSAKQADNNVFGSMNSGGFTYQTWGKDRFQWQS